MVRGVMMKIGELAGRSGTSVKTIRYYDQIGVLNPAGRSESGYRLYADDALGQLRFVRAAQMLGFSLGEIGQIIGLRDRGDTPCGYVLGLIADRASQLDERIVELQGLRDQLGDLADRAAHLDPRDCDPGLVCHVIEAVT